MPCLKKLMGCDVKIDEIGVGPFPVTQWCGYFCRWKKKHLNTIALVFSWVWCDLSHHSYILKYKNFQRLSSVHRHTFWPTQTSLIAAESQTAGAVIADNGGTEANMTDTPVRWKGCEPCEAEHRQTTKRGFDFSDFTCLCKGRDSQSCVRFSPLHSYLVGIHI